jgi:hypothetical protein
MYGPVDWEGDAEEGGLGLDPAATMLGEMLNPDNKPYVPSGSCGRNSTPGHR